MGVNLNKETKKISGKYIYINDAKKDYIQNISLESDIYQEVIEEEKGTALEGESVVISDGDINKEVKATVNGNTYQETTEGYQLLDFSKCDNKSSLVEYSFENDIATITSTGGTYKKVEWNITDLFLNSAGKLLWFTFDKAETTGDTSLIYQIEYMIGSTKKYLIWTSTKKYFTIPEDLTDVVNAYLCIYPNNSNVAREGSIIITKPRLSFVENANYEKYTGGNASPNTEYEQDIEVVDGVNRLNVHDLSEKAKAEGITVDEEDYISNSSSDSRSWAYENSNWFKKLKAGTYTIYVFVKNKPTSINSLMHIYKNEENTSIGYISYASLQSDVAKVTITLSEDAEIGIMFKIFDGVFKVMLVEGASEKPYLPYGHIGLVQRGKNRLRGSGKTILNGLTNTLENGKVTLNGTLTTNWSFILENVEIDLDIGTYTFSRSSSFAENKVFRYELTLTLEDGTKTTVYGKSDKTGQVFTLNKKAVKYSLATSNNTNGTVYNNIEEYVQIEKGSVSTEYEPYIEPKTIPINLNGNSIAKVGDIKDLLNIGLDGSVSIEKKTVREVLNGVNRLFVAKANTQNNNILLTNAFNTKIKAPYNNSIVAKHLSNYFSGNYSINYLYENDVQGSSIRSDKVFGMAFGLDSEITTVELANAFLKEHSVEVLVPLQEEYYETIELPSIKPIKLFEGTNVFELVTNLGTTMAVTYNYVTPSPSIDRPSEIKTPVGKQSFYAGNKNFINFKKWYENKNILISNSSSITLNEITENSITFTPKSDDAFTNTYAMSSTNINENKAKYETWSGISLKENTKYTVSYEKNVSAIRFMLFLLDKDFNYLGLIDNIGNGQVITTPSKTKYITYRVGAVNSKDVSITVKNIQLEENTVATDYIEHQSQVQNLDVGELLGTIVDKEDGSYFENNWKMVDGKDLNWYSVDNSSRSDNILRFNSANSDGLTTMVSLTSEKTLFSNLFKCKYILDAYTKECISPHNTEKHHINIFIDKSRLVSEDVKGLKTFLEENNCKILYKLVTPTYTKLTDEQQAQWNKIKKMHTYEGVTNIYTINDNGISPILDLEYTTKYAEEYDFYIDKNARFIVPEYDINYQVSIPESDLSDMPEASESAVKIAGKDGDVVLNTTYEPKDFNIVAYTDDNLDPKDKEAEKTKLVNFLHSIKNRTKNFGLLYREKFYPVKYNDKLTPTIYPKSIRFEIPIKSSKSLGYALEKKMIFGNGKEISNTIEETGCKIIIEGPIYGTNDSPMVITLNDYQMAYYNTVLEGNRLEIDTNNSTIKHISSNGEVTNVAAYYNHEYPKIKYGENEIKILSKIDSETQVYTEWYDLKI